MSENILGRREGRRFVRTDEIDEGSGLLVPSAVRDGVGPPVELLRSPAAVPRTIFAAAIGGAAAFFCDQRGFHGCFEREREGEDEGGKAE